MNELTLTEKLIALRDKFRAQQQAPFTTPGDKGFTIPDNGYWEWAFNQPEVIK